VAYASKAGRARVSSRNPQAFAVCDRCGIWYQWVDLRWQYDWRGATMQNIKILVCRICYDKPQEQLRAIVVPADPVPIVNARTENYVADESNVRTISQPTVIDPVTGIPIPSTTQRVTQDCQVRNTQIIGPNPNNLGDGLTQAAVMPLKGTVHYGVKLPVLSVTADGTTFITVTCSAPHGLATNDQVSVLGVSNNAATGFYSVTVTTATAFKYQISQINTIPAGSLLTNTTSIVTCSVGLPLDFPQIPQTGV